MLEEDCFTYLVANHIMISTPNMRIKFIFDIPLTLEAWRILAKWLLGRAFFVIQFKTFFDSFANPVQPSLMHFGSCSSSLVVSLSLVGLFLLYIDLWHCLSFLVFRSSSRTFLAYAGWQLWECALCSAVIFLCLIRLFSLENAMARSACSHVQIYLRRTASIPIPLPQESGVACSTHCNLTGDSLRSFAWRYPERLPSCLVQTMDGFPSPTPWHHEVFSWSWEERGGWNGRIQLNGNFMNS